MGMKTVAKTELMGGSSGGRKMQRRSCENFKDVSVRFQKFSENRTKLSSNCRKQKH